MAKYKQILTFDSEDSFGENQIEFIVADDINLLKDATVPVDVDIFEFNKLNFAFQNENGGLVQDDCDLTTADYLVKNQDEQDCLDLVKTSISSHIYCAIIINPSTPLVKDDFIYVGRFEDIINEEAVNWERAEYSDTATIIKVYKFSIKPMVESIFDDVIAKDVLDNIDSTWITNNVADRPAWRTINEPDSGGNYGVLNTYCCDLVSTNKILRKMADEAASIINTNLGTSYVINFANRVKPKGKYAPARWRILHEATKPELWVGDPAHYSTIRGSYNRAILYHNIDDGTDYKDYYIDPDEIGTVTDNNTLFVDFKYFKDIENSQEYSNESASSYRIGSGDETFADILYLIAANFDLLVLFNVDVVNEEIDIIFADSDYIDSSEVLYFKDAEKYKRDLSTKSSEQLAPFYAETFYQIGGSDVGRIAGEQGGYNYDKYKNSVSFDKNVISRSSKDGKGNDTKKSERLLFTISPTIAEMHPEDKEKNYMVADTPEVLSNPYKIYQRSLLPHNTRVIYNVYNSSDELIDSVDFKDAKNVTGNKVGWAYNTRSLHTALYVNVFQKELYEPANYFTPIRAMSVKIDNEEKYFESLEAFLNTTRLRFYKFANYDLELSIPYWNAFSTDNIGTSPNIKNLKLGKKIVLNTIEYIIHSITIDFQKPIINLKLKQEALISEIKNPSVPKTGPSILSSEDINTDEEYEFETRFINGATDPFSALFLNSDGNLKTILSPSEVDTYFGLSLENTADNYAKVIKSPGLYNIDLSGTTWSVGDYLYIRVNASTTNVNNEYLSKYVSATDKVYKRIGKVIATNTLLLFDEPNFEYE